jgi:hypothetical protein
MSRQTAVMGAMTFAAVWGACAPIPRPAVPVTDGRASLWEQPADLAERDLFFGPWGPERAPDPGELYTLVERKHSGINPGLTVRDAAGRQWSVKQTFPDEIDDEGPTEVVVSRVLSAVGYHQPPVYYLPEFRLTDAWGIHTEPGGRFRLKERTLKDRGEWAWEQNPFVGTRPYQGLLVILVMFNSSDLKTANNTVYERRADVVEHWYAVRDLGAALGNTSRLVARKGDPDAFDRERFIDGIEDGFVAFDYDGWRPLLVQRRIRPADVVWAADLLSGLSSDQWSDAFRAGGFAPDLAQRFIRRLQAKIAEGQQLRHNAPSAAERR